MARTLTPEARARIVAIQKARWAKAPKKRTPAEPVTKKATAGVHSSRNGHKSNGNGAKKEARLQDAAATLSAGTLMQLDAKTCRRSPWNREEFDDAELKKLIADVKEHGVNQNGIVRRNPGTEVEEVGGEFLVKSRGGGMLIAKFGDKRKALQLSAKLDEAEWEVIAGERRWTAAHRTGRPFPAVERKATDVEALELQATENMLREDLNPMDEATKFAQLRDAYIADGMSRMEALKRIEENTGKAESTILERLTLVTLPEAVQKMIRKAMLHASHAGLLTKLHDPSTITTLAERMKKNEHGESMSFRQAKQIVDSEVQIEKNLAEYERQAEQFRKAGRGDFIIGKKELEGLHVQDHGWIDEDSGFVLLERSCCEDATYRTYATLLGKTGLKGLQAYLAHTPSGKPVLVYKRTDVIAQIGDKLKKRPGGSSGGTSDSERKRMAAHRRRLKQFDDSIGQVATKLDGVSDSTALWRIIAHCLVRQWRSDPIRRMAKRRKLDRGGYRDPGIHAAIDKMEIGAMRAFCIEILLWCDAPSAFEKKWGESIEQICELLGVSLPAWKGGDDDGESQTSGDQPAEDEEES